MNEVVAHVPQPGITPKRLVNAPTLVLRLSSRASLPGVCGPYVLVLETLVGVFFFFFFSLSFCICYYYTACTHNRIRSPRLATFGRIETRWVREVGKFGPYTRYKDWLRRR